MPKKKTVSLSYTRWLQESVEKIGRIQFMLIGLYVAIIVIYDAFALITPDTLLWRWGAIMGLLVVVATVWYAARAARSAAYYSWLLYAYIIAGIAFAAFNVYIQRGMASKAVILFVLPILYSAVFLKKSSLLFATTVSVAAYVLASMWYAVNNPSEGYKVELYGEVAFYSALLFVVASLLWVILGAKKTSHSS